MHKEMLETQRLRLRHLNQDDTDNLFKLDSDPEVMRFISGGITTPYAVIQEEILPRILSYYQKYENVGFWAVIEKASNEFIGWFIFRPALEYQFAEALNLAQPDDVEIGWRLARSHWGKGYATEGAKLLVNKGLNEWEIKKIVAWALAENKVSIRVMEKIGLQFERAFSYTESQLPNFNASQRKAVKYGLSV